MALIEWGDLAAPALGEDALLDGDAPSCGPGPAEADDRRRHGAGPPCRRGGVGARPAHAGVAERAEERADERRCAAR